MSGRLDAAALARLPASVRRPSYDRARLTPGILHLGLGAFHRAHQAVFTEDALIAQGNDQSGWGIIGASLQRPDVPDALAAQDGLYTVETLDPQAEYRILGVLKEALFAPRDAARLGAAFAAPATRAITLTLSEKGYCLDGAGALDLSHPDIAADLDAPQTPRSAIGWLALGLDRRRLAEAGPVTILSCDNLRANGGKLRDALTVFADRAFPELGAWLRTQARFPNTLVDCIVPASSPEHRARVAAVLGVTDAASVQREAFAQWVIEDNFAGPLPDWQAAGAQIVPDVGDYERIKLHVLNTAHSALAYLGLPRGHQFARQAIADPALAGFLDAMMREEIAPALAPLDVAGYWRTVQARFRNPMLDHRLTQIAEDGSFKLPQRLFPMLIANAQKGLGITRMAAIIHAWLDLMATTPARDPQAEWLARWAAAGADKAAALDNAALFPDAFRTDARLRDAVLRDAIKPG